MITKWFKISSVGILALCLVLSWLNFSGQLSPDSFKLWFLVLSLAYFVLAVFSLGKKARP